MYRSKLEKAYKLLFPRIISPGRKQQLLEAFIALLVQKCFARQSETYLLTFTSYTVAESLDIQISVQSGTSVLQKCVQSLVVGLIKEKLH